MKGVFQKYFFDNLISEASNYLVVCININKDIQSIINQMAEIILSNSKGREWFERVMVESIEVIINSNKNKDVLLSQIIQIVEGLYLYDDEILNEFIIDIYYIVVRFYKSTNQTEQVMDFYKKIITVMEDEILLDSLRHGYECGAMFRLAEYLLDAGNYMILNNRLVDGLLYYSKSIRLYEELNMTEDLDMKICAYYDQVPGKLEKTKISFQDYYEKLSEFERALYKKLMKEESQ